MPRGWSIWSIRSFGASDQSGFRTQKVPLKQWEIPWKFHPSSGIPRCTTHPLRLHAKVVSGSKPSNAWCKNRWHRGFSSRRFVSLPEGNVHKFMITHKKSMEYILLNHIYIYVSVFVWVVQFKTCLSTNNISGYQCLLIFPTVNISRPLTWFFDLLDIRPNIYNTCTSHHIYTYIYIHIFQDVSIHPELAGSLLTTNS